MDGDVLDNMGMIMPSTNYDCNPLTGDVERWPARVNARKARANVERT